MSTPLLNRVWESEYGDPSTALLLMAMADQANDAGECRVKLSKLATKARQSERNCRTLIYKLAEEGIIDVIVGRGRKHNNIYQLHLEKLPKPKQPPVEPAFKENGKNFPVSKPGNRKAVPVIEENRQDFPIFSENNRKTVPVIGLENQQFLPVIEENRKAVPVIEGGKPAMVAGITQPFPPDPLTQDTTKDQNQDLSPSLSLSSLPAHAPEDKTGVDGGGSCQETDVAFMALKQLVTPGFQQVWTVYPASRRDRQKQCGQVWHLKHLEGRAAECVEKIKRLKVTQWVERKNGTIPTLLTWLSEDRYEDPLVEFEEHQTADNLPYRG